MNRFSAANRVHRIRQTGAVTACKLIVGDTVEEKILDLQKRKPGLASGLLESEEPLAAGLTTEDLAEFIAPQRHE